MECPHTVAWRDGDRQHKPDKAHLNPQQHATDEAESQRQAATSGGSPRASPSPPLGNPPPPTSAGRAFAPDAAAAGAVAAVAFVSVIPTPVAHKTSESNAREVALAKTTTAMIHARTAPAKARAEADQQRAWLDVHLLRRYPHQVPGDGDCLYSALAALSWERLPEDALVLRAAVMGFARLNATWLVPGMPGLTLMEALGADRGNERLYARILGELSLANTWSEVTFARVAAHVIGAPVAQVDATDGRHPERWTITPLTPHDWVADGCNVGTWLIIFNGDHWDAARLTSPQDYAAPGTVPRSVPVLQDVYDAARGALAAAPGVPLPRTWAAVAQDGGEVDPKTDKRTFTYLATDDVVSSQHCERDIAVDVAMAVLNYGWSLSWTLEHDSLSIHAPSDPTREMFILPPFSPGHHGAPVTWLRRWMNAAAGGKATLDMVVVVPVMYREAFVTVGLSIEGVYVYHSGAICQGPEPEVISSLHAAWTGGILPSLLRVRANKVSAKQWQRINDAQAAPPGPIWYMDVFDTFHSRFPVLNALAVYYGVVADLRSGSRLGNRSMTQLGFLTDTFTRTKLLLDLYAGRQLPIPLQKFGGAQHVPPLQPGGPRHNQPS